MICHLITESVRVLISLKGTLKKASNKFRRKDSAGVKPRVRVTHIGPRPGVVVIKNVPDFIPASIIRATVCGD
jgi:hypothetical protein